MTQDSLSGVDANYLKEDGSLSNKNITYTSGIALQNKIFYNQQSTDEAVEQMKLIHKDFVNWFNAVLLADGVFDNILKPYSKGAMPYDKRIVSKEPEYRAKLNEIERDFHDKLNTIIDFIIDYSNSNKISLSYNKDISDTIPTVHDSDDIEVLSDFNDKGGDF